METRRRGAWKGIPSTALETSLVEWKHSSKNACGVSQSSLGNFLSGMETRVREGGPDNDAPLETSLVEWKRTKLAEALEITPGLGNFLSGMETPK